MGSGLGGEDMGAFKAILGVWSNDGRGAFAASTGRRYRDPTILFSSRAHGQGLTPSSTSSSPPSSLPEPTSRAQSGIGGSTGRVPSGVFSRRASAIETPSKTARHRALKSQANPGISEGRHRRFSGVVRGARGCSCAAPGHCILELSRGSAAAISWPAGALAPAVHGGP